jgi:hypothetical protein
MKLAISMQLGYHGGPQTMHAMLITVILAVGADQDISSVQAPVAGSQILAGGRLSPTMVGNQGSFPNVPEPYHYDPPRDPQEADGLVRGFFNYCRAWFQPMPQTCYSPHFGCYPGNGRDIYRYPAFHGYYYRQAYNYRPLFEYPWQACMHEPLALELSSERLLGGGPQVSQPIRAEVIETPPPSRP